jgi:hypothetical protein
VVLLLPIGLYQYLHKAVGSSATNDQEPVTRFSSLIYLREAGRPSGGVSLELVGRNAACFLITHHPTFDLRLEVCANPQKMERQSGGFGPPLTPPVERGEDWPDTIGAYDLPPAKRACPERSRGRGLRGE